jgi:hypothetical protein
VILLGSLDRDLTVGDESEGKAHSEARVPANSGEAPVVSRGEGEVDKERRDAAVQMAGMARSIASWRG